MTPLEILLILIGTGIIIFSCLLVDKSSNKGETFAQMTNEASKRELTTEEIAEIKKKIDTIVTEVSEETVVKTEDQLSKISNEKIIAVNDFSKQIMEKINQNHEEVVFLYTMLNEKESELKDTMKQVDHTKKQLLETDLNNQKNTKSKDNMEYSKTNSANIGIEELDQAFQITNRPLDEMDDNSNEKILDFHAQGKSIIEISKILGLGQGEVKLVINLFKKK